MRNSLKIFTIYISFFFIEYVTNTYEFIIVHLSIRIIIFMEKGNFFVSAVEGGGKLLIFLSKY